ncbi:MAG: phosphatase PAP2 family protein, partial [Saccharofermentans sp.]|nr:phosphatase PAP2 family protein [Saccharofermentans sp.]
RPRYRLVVQGYEGTGFIPWYIRFNGAGELVEKFGIDKGEFRSFPSGHSILSMSVIVILQMLSWSFEKLKDKRLVMSVLGFVFALMIMGTRMMLGAHYLSDVSFGALICSVMALAFTAVQHKITTSPNS